MDASILHGMRKKVMSEAKPYFIHQKAKKQSGEPSAVFWESAKSDTRALRDAENALEDADKDPANYFKAVVTNFPVVDDLPEEGVISFAWCDRYQIGDDGMTWGLIPGVQPLNPILQGNADASVIVETEAKQELTHGSGSKPEVDYDELYKDDDSVLTQLATMPFRIQLLAQLGAEESHVYHISRPHSRELSAQEMDMENSYVQNLLLAVENSPEVKAYDMPGLWKLTDAIKKVFPKGKRHELNQFIQFTKVWVKTEYIDRGILTREWAAGNRINGVQRTDSGTNADGGYITDRGEGAHHTLDSLDLEIACATLPMDFNPHEIPGGVLRRAKEVIAKKEEPWKSWSFILRNQPGVLGVNRFAIFNVIRIAPENIHHNAVKHLEFVQTTMTEEFNTATALLPLPSAAPELSSEDVDKMLAAERGEFVPGISDPDDTKWVKTETKSAVENLGGGVFSIDGLLNQTASNEGVKSEVETTNDVQVQTSDRDEKQAGDALQSGEVVLRPGEGTGCDGMETAVTSNAEILAAAAPVLANQDQAEVNQKPENVSQNSDSVNHNVPETAENVPDVKQTWPTTFEPGRYENVPNEVYHAANGISSTQLKDARISLMFYNARHVEKTIPREETKAFLFGGHSHAFILEPGKIDAEYAVPVAPPADLIRTTADMTAIIKEHNDSLPAVMSPEEMKSWIEQHNITLTPPLSLSASADETAELYMSLPEIHQRIPEGTKHTATAQKACIKEYNSTLPPMLKTSGSREQLLDQIATVSPELAEAERAKLTPLNTSGSRAQLIEAVRLIRPDVKLADDFEAEQELIRAGRTYISLDMYLHVKAIEKAVFEHPSASRLLDHPSRKSEVSYFGFDEDTGLEIRVRPDLELQLSHARIGGDLKTIDLGNVKQERLRDRLHREIIERDYHLSAAMYCDVANLDQFYWIFVNKTPGYHWVAVVEASPDELMLGRLEYRRTLRMINDAMMTNNWPAPIVDDYTDELNDFDLRRLEALGAE